MIEPVAPDTRSDQEVEPSTQDNEGLFLTIKEWVMADIEKSAAWRTRARGNFSFLSGVGDAQWDQDALKILRDERRPVITFNRSLKYVTAVRGLEINNRHETIYLPRDTTQMGKVVANEMLTQCSEWMDQQCNAPRHKSRAFRDMLVTGMGWTESVMDYDEDPRGKYVRVRCNPLEMGWDYNSRDQNLSDSKRRWRIREMLLSEARQLVPGVTDSPKVMDIDLNASWAADVSVDDGKVKSKEQKELREESKAVADPKRKVYIVQVQWFEYETYHRVNVPDPSTPGGSKNVDIPAGKLDQATARAAEYGITLTASRPLRKKVFKQAFVGAKILSVGPAPRPDGFTFNPMTYEPEDNDGTWFGMVDVMRDVQIWCNKLFSQALHIVNTTAKGGVLAEQNVFPDIKDAQKTFARTDAITEVADGALRNGRIIAKPGQGNPAWIVNLLKMTMDSFTDVLGINLELMGLADRDQPGILEAQRKQAAMTILAAAFDSVSLYEQEEGRTKLYFIQNHIAATPRMIRIVGDDGYQLVPLLRDKTLGEYDVVVEDAPSAPNTKEKAWQALGMIVPPLERNGLLTPEAVAAMLDYVPYLPSKLVQVLKKIATQPDPDADMKRRLAITKVTEEIAGMRATREKDEATRQSTLASGVLSLVKAGSENARVNLDQWNALLEASGIRAAMDDIGDDGGQPSGLGQLPQLGSQPGAPQVAPETMPAPVMPMSPPMPGGIVPPGGLQQ